MEIGLHGIRVKSITISKLVRDEINEGKCIVCNQHVEPPYNLDIGFDTLETSTIDFEHDYIGIICDKCKDRYGSYEDYVASLSNGSADLV